MRVLLGIVTSDRRLPGGLALLLIVGLLLTPAAPARAVVGLGNDNRANALLWEYGHTYGDSTADATNEAGETGALSGCDGPQPTVPSSAHSVWFRFTPSRTAIYVFDVTSAGFDTVLSIETSAGSTIACNDDKVTGDTKSKVAKELIAGQTYYIRLAGWSTASGAYIMTMRALPPMNNDRADATYLSTSLDHAAVSLLEADTETDELDPPGCEYGMQQTVWFRYHANSTGRLSITNHWVHGTRMRLFEVTAGDPQVMVCDSYHDGLTGDDGLINQYVTAGRDYLLQIGRPSGGSIQGGTSISTSFAASLRPANDSFATPTTLTGSTGAVDVEAAQMTTEPWEFPLYGATVGWRSAWYRWTAPSSGTLRLTFPPNGQNVLVWADVAYPELLDRDGLGTITYPRAAGTSAPSR
ncbi:hypothetical protein [Nocardioides humi]|uniref:hypothetical protein n=1 Tax=Nocardioides humi TaxID=449461 RepID=UPI0015E8563D|nr:hypothetical protein [Nocardioides humi]